MVLRGNLHAVRKQIHNRLIASAVPVGELLHGGSSSKANHLVPQADAEDGHLANKPLNLGVRLPHGVWIAWPVGKKDAVGAVLEHLGGRRVPWHDEKLAPHTREPFDDAPLHAAVVHHDLLARIGRGGRSEGAALGKARRIISVGLLAAYGLHEVRSHEVGGAIEHVSELGKIKYLG